MKMFFAIAALIAGLFVFSAAPATAASCDCQKELQRLSDARTDAERLEEQVAKAIAAIAGAQGDADRRKREAETLARQLRGTADLMRRARAKGANVDTQDVRAALKDAEQELRDAQADYEREAAKTAELRARKDALEERLKQARAAAKDAEKAYRACRARCLGMKEDKKKPRQIFVVRGSDVDSVFPHCDACDAANGRLQRAKAEYDAALRVHRAAQDDLAEAAEGWKTSAAEARELGEQYGRAERNLYRVRNGLRKLGASDLQAVRSQDYKDAERTLDDMVTKVLGAQATRDHYQRRLNRHTQHAEQTRRALMAAERALYEATRALDNCNKSCRGAPQGSSRAGLIPGFSFGIGLGTGGGRHHRRTPENCDR